VADALVDRCGAQILVNAAPNAAERALADSVAHHMRRKPILNLADRDNTLGLLKGLLSRCDLLITNDTGARHIAAAVGAAVVTIFGSTDPVWAKIDYDRERIIRADVPCSPCQKKTCPLPEGPGHHQCMTAVSADTVLEAAGELLKVRQEARR
jgi:heptosyltransferase-2